MPRTKTTWQKGTNPTVGRPHGAKDIVPRGGRACIRMLLEEFGANEDLLRDAILRGLAARSPSHFPFVRMLIEQHAGAPDQTLAVVTKVVHEIHET